MLTVVLNLLLEWKFDFQTLDWRVISAIAAVIGIILVFYFQWWRNRKRLSYEILSNVLLLSAEEEIQDKVEIQYEGKTVECPATSHKTSQRRLPANYKRGLSTVDKVRLSRSQDSLR